QRDPDFLDEQQASDHERENQAVETLDPGEETGQSAPTLTDLTSHRTNILPHRQPSLEVAYDGAVEMRRMPIVTRGLSTSVDGFIAGADDSPEQPLGVGGERLFDWFEDGDTPSRYYPSGRAVPGGDAHAGAPGAARP